MRRPDLLRPDAQVEVEPCLQQQVLHIVGVDGEVEVQRVSQELVGFLIAVPNRKRTINQNIESDYCDRLPLLHWESQGCWSPS